MTPAATSTPSPSPEQMRRRGRALREQIPRTSLADVAERPSSYDVVGRLMWQGESRQADLVPLRYKRMLANPLSFYRGNALLMADDLARGSNTPIEVQICGDAHLSNFNLFSSPERRHVFDVNDFDETDLGPFEWDVKRLIASLAVASAHLGHDDKQQERIVHNAAREYRRSIRRFARKTPLEIWYAALDVNAVVADLGGFFSDAAIRRVDDVVAHAGRSDTAKAFSKLVVNDGDGPRIVSTAPLLVPLSELENDAYLSRDDLEQILVGYAETLSSDRRALLAQFTPVDVARKVVGVGSVGTECYVVLLLGRDESDPFFLQIKQATASVVALAFERARSVAPGQRVVEGQRLMQATSDVFLGWHSFEKDSSTRHYYVRQLYDHKAAINLEQLDEKLLVTYGRICAWVLARAHARSGRGPEIAGYLGKSEVADGALATFAATYRDRVVDDFRALQHAATEGRITVAQ